ncbi:MAG: hypothetical protein K2X91_18970, partial [Thermoleophilia bacterium]|nr:hypothetical protein [Thermoleophilia bacterium]
MSDTYTPSAGMDPIEGQPLPPAAPSMWTPEAEPDRIDREASYYEASRGLALREAFEDAQITERLGGFLEASRRRTFAAQRNRVFGTDAPLTAEEANDQFGVPGRLSFDAPVDRNIAAWQQSLAQREAFREAVIANAEVGPLELIGAGLA